MRAYGAAILLLACLVVHLQSEATANEVQVLENEGGIECTDLDTGCPSWKAWCGGERKWGSYSKGQVESNAP